MNKKFTISIPSSAYEPPRREAKKTEQSDEERSHAVRRDDYIEESQSDDERSEKAHKSTEKSGQPYPLVEFEEFTVERKPALDKDRKKRYEIEVPEIKFEGVPAAKREVEADDTFKEYICKEPPAPSKGSTKAKVFVFPTTQPTLPTASQKDRPNRYGQTTVATPNNQQLERQQQQRLETTFNDDFSKERQRYERELLIKDAQIEVLQKLIGEHMQMKHQFASIHEAERILVEKDLRHGELLGKLQEMSGIIKDKNDEISELRHENHRLQGALQALQHNLYLLTRKEENCKLTRDFLELRQHDDEHNKSIWDEERRTSLKQEGCFRNIQELQKRLDYLKNNRIELEASKSRQKNKSVLTSMPKEEVMWCSMTSKHRPKGTFDFKFQKERSIEGSLPSKKKDLY